MGVFACSGGLVCSSLLVSMSSSMMLGSDVFGAASSMYCRSLSCTTCSVPSLCICGVWCIVFNSMGWLAGESTENCSINSWFLCHDDMSGKSLTNVLSRGGVWRVAGVVSVCDLSDDRIPCGLMDVFDVFFISSASCFAGSSPELICSTFSAPKICLSWFDRLSVNTFPNTPLLDTSFSVTMCWGSSSLVAIVNNVVYATPVALSLN